MIGVPLRNALLYGAHPPDFRETLKQHVSRLFGGAAPLHSRGKVSLGAAFRGQLD